MCCMVCGGWEASSRLQVAVRVTYASTTAAPIHHPFRPTYYSDSSNSHTHLISTATTSLLLTVPIGGGARMVSTRPPPADSRCWSLRLPLEIGRRRQSGGAGELRFGGADLAAALTAALLLLFFSSASYPCVCAWWGSKALDGSI